MNPLSIYIETYGCQMNKLDTEYVDAILQDAGYAVVQDIHAADVILINTCAVRERAEQRIFGRVGELMSLMNNKPELLFGILGCMAEHLGDKLLSRTVRIVAGPDSYRKLPDMIEQAASDGVVDTDLDNHETYDGILPMRRDSHSAWIAVMRGCNNFCTYCIVPYTRGRERSIPKGEILHEVGVLKDAGVKEVTLLGQNVNSYHDGQVDFAELLDHVAATGIDWIRFLTSHPKDLSLDILEMIAKHDSICRHLHLPLQSGSDAVLAAMNRRYTVADYIALVENARSMVPGISVTTDLMFGFPGETDDDFMRTLDLIERVRFDFAFLYRYSDRDGTKSYSMENKVPEELRIERLKEAITLQTSIMRQKNREHIGESFVVLVKGPSKDGKGLYGFTETNIPIVFTAENRHIEQGMFVTVHVENTTGASLLGTAVP